MIRELTTVALVTLGAGCTSSDGTSSDVLQIESCHGQTSDPFSLGDLSLQDGLLVAPVQTASSSAHPSFAVCWDGVIYDTYPGQADLRLFYDAHGDASDVPQTQDIRIDLAPVIKHNGLPIWLVTFVANDDSTRKTVTWWK